MKTKTLVRSRRVPQEQAFRPFANLKAQIQRNRERNYRLSIGIDKQYA